MSTAPAFQDCATVAPGSILNSDPGIYVYPPNVSSVLNTAGRMVARGTLTDTALEDLIRLLIAPVPRAIRGDTVAAMLRTANWARNDEDRIRYDVSIKIIRDVKHGLKFCYPDAEIVDRAMERAGGSLSRTEVAGLMRGCSIEHAENLKRYQPPAERRRMRR